MKTKKHLLHFFLFAVLISINAQKKKLLNPFETNGDLNSQFIYLEKTSTNYKEYKVITKAKFKKLHNNVLDSLSYERKKLNEIKIENQRQLYKIKGLESKLLNIKKDLQLSNTNKDSITVMGVLMHKDNYIAIMGLIILSLFASALFFLYKFYRTNITTKEAIRNLKETQDEYDEHQKKTLKRQQELSRRLQDEIIKNKKE
jgi:hypothetical protein